MPIPVIMPKLEMSQETALVLEWIKKEGEQVNQGEALMLVETDKVTFEIESTDNGVLAGILVKENDVVPVTTTIAYLLQKGETKEDIPPQKILTADGQQKNQEITQYPKYSSATPVASRMAEAEGIDINQITGTGRSGEITRADVEAVIQSRNSTYGKLRATPSARKASRYGNLPLGEIKGSGPHGRVQLIDVQTQLQKGIDTSDSTRTIRFEGIRRTIAERMQLSYQTIPHIYFTTSVDMTSLESLRSALNNRKTNSSKIHITITCLLVRYIARALMQHPLLNSSLKQNMIQINNNVNIGVAVALVEGLIVPVIKNADQKSTDEISVELGLLTEKARTLKLQPLDVAGGTFTISNLGASGIEEFTAIINPGQTGILAIGSVSQQPVVMGQQVVIRPIMKVTLAVDHRVIDGYIAVKFLMELKSYLENPALSER